MTGALLVLGSWLVASALLGLLLGAVVRRADHGAVAVRTTGPGGAPGSAAPLLPASRAPQPVALPVQPVPARPASDRSVTARAGAELVR